MKFKIATALVALTAALGFTGTASAWWFYVPPQPQKSNSEQKLEKTQAALAANYRG